jgi:hypothetical protein
VRRAGVGFSRGAMVSRRIFQTPGGKAGRQLILLNTTGS